MYLETPYNKEHKSKISFLICCRVFNSNEFQLLEKLDNDRSLFFNLYVLFQSICKYTRKDKQTEMEFLLKLDSDNDIAIKEYITDNKLKEYFPNLTIRPFIHQRWEGRNSLYLTYTYLFSKINPSSHFIGFLSDDMMLTDDRSGTNDFMSDIDKYINEDYIVLNSKLHQDKLDLIFDYKKDSQIWRDGWITDPSPIVSKKIIECMGNIGWQNNIDSTITAIAMILKTKYGINILKKIAEWSLRGKKQGGFLPTNDFNNEYCIAVDKVPTDDSYFWNLMEQAAKNLALNIRN